MINEIQSNVMESQNKAKVAEDSWTGDTQGFEYLYKIKFELLFLQIKKIDKLY